MTEQERLARFFFFQKYLPSNDALAYNLRWEDIPFDGCSSSKPFYDQAYQFLVVAEQTGYVQLPPDSAILCGISKLREGLQHQIE